MARLFLEKNEYTVESLLEAITEKYGGKGNGSPFSNADIHDWANKRRIPKQYGGQYVRIKKAGPLKILELSETAFENFEVEKVEVENE